MGWHKIRYRVLLFAGSLIFFVISLKESLIDLMVWFSHIMKYLIGNMFRCYTELSTDMVLHKFFQKNRTFVCNYIIKTDTWTDKYFFDPRNFPQFPKQRNVIWMIHSEIFAGFRKQTLPVLADTLCQLFLTRRLTEICGRSADIMNITFEIRILCHFSGFFEYRFMTPGL